MRNSIPFVLIFLVLTLVSNASAELVAHYKFDGGANDSSGYGHHGTQIGSPAYDPGVLDLAINIDGIDDYVVVGSVGISGNAPRTITGWVRANSLDIPDWTTVFGFTNDTEQHYACFDIEKWGYGDHYAIHVYYWESAIMPLDLDWHHLAATYDGTTIAWYGDGSLIGSEDLVLNTIDNVQIGMRPDTNRYFTGLIDDVRIYHQTLTLAEIIELIHGAGASNPNPADGDTIDGEPYPASGEPTHIYTTLEFTTGYDVVSHDAFFSDVFAEVFNRVEDANLGPPPTAMDRYYVGIPFPEYTTYTDSLERGTTYYWCVDVTDSSNVVWKGPIWSFRITPLNAYNPSPVNGEHIVDRDAILSWDCGYGAQEHDVYFGTSWEDVNNAYYSVTDPSPEYMTTQQVGYEDWDPVANGGFTLDWETTYYWRIDEVSGRFMPGTGTYYLGDIWEFTTIREFGGLRGNYYQFDPLLADIPPGFPPLPYEAFNDTTFVLTRIDPVVDFIWGDGNIPGEFSPDPNIDVDDFAARWVGRVEAGLTQNYTFTTSTDDGTRLWIDDELIINQWIQQGATKWSGTIDLIAGETYPFVFEYYEHYGSASAQLYWSAPTVPEQIIPAGALTPPYWAYDPDPSHNCTTVDPTEFLQCTWTQGDNAVEHRVYWGTNPGSLTLVATKPLAEPNYDPGPLAFDTDYYWRVDEANGTNVWEGKVWTFRTVREPGLGSIVGEIWRGIAGTDMNNLKLDPCFPYNSDNILGETGEISEFDTEWHLPGNELNDYGGRVRGYLIPKTSGDYRFWICTDNPGELWLSTNEKPCSAELIAYIPTDNRAYPYVWNTHATQDSNNVVGPIYLEGGQRYYICALWKEGDGGDHCQVAWQGPDQPNLPQNGWPEATEAIIDGYYLSPYFPGDIWAVNPSPASGANIGVMEEISINWSPGDGAVTHDVYFGTDQAAVTDANNSSPEFQDNLPLGTESYTVTGLVPFTTYYWRIDEVNGTNVWKGCVWFFITGKDCNGNGVADPVDIASGTSLDCNGNGIPDECDIDSGTSQDINGNGVPDECDPDCNINGVPDDVDIATGTSLDCNGNGIPDECDITNGTSQDINGNGVPDECDPDCNGNGVPDDIDIANGTSTDVNGDDIPDECQIDVRIVPIAVLIDPASTSEVRTTLPDSITAVARGDTYYVEIWASDAGDENTGVTSVYVDVSFCSEMSTMSLEHGTIFTSFPTGTIQSGGVDEFGGSGLPSGIEPEWVRVGWIEMICNAEVPECTISLLESTTGIAALERGPIPWWAIHLGSITLYRDCNGNGIPDTNDIANGTSQDINGNGVPDECDPDCNGNGVPDDIDIANGTSTDTDEDGIPDECGIDVRVVPVAVLINPASMSEVRTTLPDSMPAVVRGSTYYIEIWASDLGAINTGLTSVYVDVSFCGQTSASGLEHGTIFTTFPSGTIQAGGVDEFGGTSALPSGIEPEWVRVGWIQMSADVDVETCTISLLPSFLGVAASERGLIPWIFVDLNSVELQITPPARSYNLDGDAFIGPGDWSYFVGSWLQSVPPADAEDDFDCDCFVGVGDLSWFATGWMKFTDDPTILYPPCPDPNCGGEMSARVMNAGMMSAETGVLDTSTDVAFEVVVLDAESGSDTTTTLPASVDQITNGQTYYVELWVSDMGDIDTGITSAYVDLSFPGSVLSVVSISHGGIFTAVPTGSAGSSVIDELGGSALSEGIGVEPEWARVAVVQMYADTASPFVAFTLSHSSTGIGAYGRGQIPWGDVSLSSFIIAPPADLNKNGRVDFFDFSILGDQWRGTPGDPSADIAPEPPDGVVDWFDLAAILEYWLGGITP